MDYNDEIEVGRQRQRQLPSPQFTPTIPPIHIFNHLHQRHPMAYLMASVQHILPQYTAEAQLTDQLMDRPYERHLILKDHSNILQYKMQMDQSPTNSYSRLAISQYQKPYLCILQGCHILQG